MSAQRITARVYRKWQWLIARAGPGNQDNRPNFKDNPERGVTIAYYRDRNEKHHITHYKDEQAYYEDTQETAFLYKYGRWYQNGTPIATPKEEAETIRKERSKS